MKVLVTGGAGYIGSHVCKALAHAGMEPVVFDNLSTGHRWAVKWGPLVEGDLADEAAIRAAICMHRVEAVMHFAASAYVGESMTNPRKYFENNARNTLNLLGAMLDSGIKRIVFSSTCATYGVPERIPMSETHSQRPVNPYGETKLFVERALGWYDAAYSLRYVALRYFNAAGSDLEGEIGEDHEPETHLIPLILQTVSGQIPQLQIFGTDYPTPDGTAIRDYIHVTDLAQAHVLALQYLLQGSPSTAFNLGTGRGYSVREVIGAVERVTGYRVPTKEAPRRSGDPPELVADAAYARQALKWSPQYSELDTIVDSAWRWEALQTQMRQA